VDFPENLGPSDRARLPKDDVIEDGAWENGDATDMDV
jgi:hypothetical protein